MGSTLPALQRFAVVPLRVVVVRVDAPPRVVAEPPLRTERPSPESEASSPTDSPSRAMTSREYYRVTSAPDRGRPRPSQRPLERIRAPQGTPMLPKYQYRIKRMSESKNLRNTRRTPSPNPR